MGTYRHRFWFSKRTCLLKNPKVKEASEIFIGFGILFIGMSSLSSALQPLKEIA